MIYVFANKKNKILPVTRVMRTSTYIDDRNAPIIESKMESNVRNRFEKSIKLFLKENQLYPFIF